VNREVAKWTRSWLPGALPEPVAAEEDDQQQGPGQKRKWQGGRGGGGRWKRKGLDRREAPVLLICGAPGGSRGPVCFVWLAGCVRCY